MAAIFRIGLWYSTFDRKWEEFFPTLSKVVRFLRFSRIEKIDRVAYD